METAAQGVLHRHQPRKHERQLSVAMWVVGNEIRALGNTVHGHLQSLMLGHNVGHPVLNRRLQRSEKRSIMLVPEL